MEDIINGQINSGIDLFLGAGYTDYLPYQNQLENKQYLFTNQFDQLSMHAEKVFGCFKEIVNYQHQNDTPTPVSYTHLQSAVVRL